MPRGTVSGFLMLIAVLVLSACEASPPAQHAQDPRAAIDAALTALSAETAVTYDLAGGTVFTVTGKGLAQGMLSLRDQQVSALRAGGDLYLRAPAAYWQAQGMSADRAAQYGTRWARSVLAFDPGWMLAPATIAQTLRTAVQGTVRATRTTAGGLDVFDTGGLRVTTEPPYRVVSFDSSLLGGGSTQALGDGSVGVRGLRPAELPALRDAYNGAVDSLGQPFVAGPVVAASVTDNALSCTASGACTDTVQVSNKLVGDAPRASARLALTSSVSSSRLGEQSCGQEVVAALDESTTMSCSVKFALPKLSGTAKVSAVPVVTAEPVARVDAAGFKQAAAVELGR
ncbi:hypothetical protein [Amycolatopsis sp. GM8]|uniref:hypothetical protein n=1 Tax=Amycolatopsis sp. GM8 TaxID=2896530 RepID=UPI001F1C84CA|nr:hypothetical protein [Amycolatopsis sp. GM8]